MKPIITWILIANGARARAVKHAGIGTGLTEVKTMTLFDDRLSISQIMSDRAGRTFTSMEKSRSAMQLKTDPVAKREADFIRLVADNLNIYFKNKCFDRLVIFAAPHAMGDLRQALSSELRDAILKEIPKDLTNIPNEKIAKHLEDIMLV